MTQMEIAPIALFVYNRPEHTRKTLAAIRMNKEIINTDLFIFSDGARRPENQASVKAVRQVIANVEGFRSVNVVLRNQNLGLAESIITGVSEILEKRNTVIVLEDDIVVGKSFLQYMNQALLEYASNEKVASVHGWNFPLVDTNRDFPDTFFLRGADCWGWATWKRAWHFFEPNGKILLEQLIEKNLEYDFDLDGAYPYTQMLRDQITGRNNSWAIRWHASAYLRGMVTLHPAQSLVKNIGFDGSGVHSQPDARLETTISSKPFYHFPESVCEDIRMRGLIIEYWKANKSPSFFRTIVAKMKWRISLAFSVFKRWHGDARPPTSE
jgi:hypothetical protein